MAASSLWLSLWRGGAYRAASLDPGSGLGALVECSGNGTVRLAAVTAHGFEEIVATRHAVRHGVSIRTSNLSGDREGRLRWDWQVQRPGLRRHEHWRIENDGRGSWEQVDIRPGRTTTYRSSGPDQFAGDVRAPDGSALWTVDWRSDGSGGMTGTYSGPGGIPAGAVSYPGPNARRGGAPLTWSGPVSTGSIEAEPGGTTRRTRVVTRDGATTWTSDEAGPHQVQSGSGPGKSWIGLTAPGAERDAALWIDMGNELRPSPTGAAAWSIEYTINGERHADGSQSYARVDRDRTTGDANTAYGSIDAHGNTVYSETIRGADGAVTVVTRTMDGEGNGTEHATDFDTRGNETLDQTIVIRDSKRSQDITGAEGDAKSLTAVGRLRAHGPHGSGSDPNNPHDPDSPDAPDVAGSGSGLPTDDGTDDRTPAAPPGRLGADPAAGVTTLFSGIRAGTGGDLSGSEASVARNGEWIRELTREIQDASGGNIDDMAWSPGGAPDGRPVLSHVMAEPPREAGEPGWGDLSDPRALVALLETLITAVGGIAGSGNLLRAVQRQQRT